MYPQNGGIANYNSYKKNKKKLWLYQGKDKKTNVMAFGIPLSYRPKRSVSLSSK